MENDIYIPDANIILEYVFDRKHSSKARQILADAINEKIQLIVPSLFLDEITEVLCGNLDNLVQVQQHLRYLEQLAHQEILNIVIPNTDIRMKAVEIARTGHSKSGYPELSDSIYHALAISNNAIFITNDERHFAKVEIFGHIKKLADY